MPLILCFGTGHRVDQSRTQEQAFPTADLNQTILPHVVLTYPWYYICSLEDWLLICTFTAAFTGIIPCWQPNVGVHSSTRQYCSAMREQSGLACTLICGNGWSRGLRHTFIDVQLMRVACTGFPITPWADSCKSGFVLPWDSVLWHWCLKSLSSFPFVNARHQRKGNESPRDATDTRNHPSFVRHKHHLSFESYAGA